MKTLKLMAAALLMTAFGAQAAKADPIDPKVGPWISNVTETSFTVVWTTEKKVLSWVDACEDNGVTWYRSANKRYFQDIDGRHFAGTFHSVEVTGLEPGKTYMYRIGGRTVEDDMSNAHANNYGPDRVLKTFFKVKTLDSKADECRFSVVNDIHANLDRFSSLMEGFDPAQSDFFVMNGDMVSVSKCIDTVMRYCFEPMGEKAGNVPVIYARGNHEGRGADWYLVKNLFPTPTGQYYFSLRQGPAGIIVLDAGEDKPDTDVEYSGTAAYDAFRARELEWLREAVKDPAFASAPQKICIMHIPTFGEKSSWYTQKWITDNFLPILNAAGVKLMISGHHHRFMLKDPGTYGNDYTIYVNDCTERLDVVCTSSGISLKSYDTAGALKHTLDL